MADAFTMKESTMRALATVHFPASEIESALRIAWRESNWQPLRHNDNYKEGGRDDSYGLFQINMLGDLGVDRRARWGILADGMLYDPNFNFACARKLWNENGGSWTGSQAWGSIPSSRNYPSDDGDGDGNVDPQELAANLRVWNTIPQEDREYLHNIPLAAWKLVIRTALPVALTDEQWATIQWAAGNLDNAKALNEAAGGDLVIDVGTSAGIPGPPGIPGLPNPLEALRDIAKAIGKVVAILTNPEFWKRIGLGVLAAAILVIGIVFFVRQETIGKLGEKE